MTSNLKKGLTANDATAVVVGTMIGTGVFLKAGIMSQLSGSAGLVLLAWMVAGIMSLIGAFVYAEMGGMFQATGGEYVYLNESYGPLPAFLYGWMRFWITGPGTIAAYAVGAATFLEGFIQFEFENARVIIAILFIALLSSVNCLPVKVGGLVQLLLTILKVVIMLGLTFLFFTKGNTAVFSGTAPTETILSENHFSWTVFGSAILAALWAYDGWNNLPMMSGEVHNPSRSVPRALVIGVFTVMTIYLAINAGYFHRSTLMPYPLQPYRRFK
jgi:basic amino acid/polyamine antiporter, APA family